MANGQSKRTELRNKTAIFLRKNGFYVVMGLCVLCIAIAAAVRFLPRRGEEPVEPPSSEEARQSEDDRFSDVLMIPTPQPTQAPVSTPASALPAVTPVPSTVEQPVVTRAPVKGAAPVEGEILFGYAMNSLLYSKTLELWTTHDGVDIAAKEGTDVHAVMAGEVLRVYEDSALGQVVEISHDGGLLSVYGNLQMAPPVEDGQKVDASTVIGHVGMTAQSECALPAHLHFAIFKDGVAQEPTAYVLLAKP